MMSSTIWGCCEKMSNEEHVKCKQCKHGYHLACLHPSGANVSDYAKGDWKCANCTPRRINRENTPIKGSGSKNVTKRTTKRPAFDSPELVSPSNENITKEEMRSMFEEIVDSKIDNLFTRLQATIRSNLAMEMKPIKEELSAIKDSINFMDDQFRDLKESQVESVIKIKQLEDEKCNMQSSIASMSSRINQLEQNARAANIEIQCVPERKDENLITIVNNLCNTIGNKIGDQDVVKCMRIAKIDRTNQRPRSIVVQFSNPKIRDSILAAAIQFNKKNPSNRLNSTHLSIPGDKMSIYISEHLSPTNKALHAEVRLRAKEKGYKHVWVRNGRIYTRKSDNSNYIIITNKNALNMIV